MYTDKKSILQLTSLLRSHGIRRIVVTPGSRNIPLAQTFASCPDFDCYSVTDERSAGFFAIGLALQDNCPTAVCCTSGSALLNLHPAVAEAYYQQVPLLVISADRPACWIGQMDGQTLPQPAVFHSLVRQSVNLPEVKSEEDAWYCNRLINEALLELHHRIKGPVHINVPVSEPFFSFPTEELPEERTIARYLSLDTPQVKQLMHDTFSTCSRCIIVGGQTTPEEMEAWSCRLPQHCVFLCENLHNGPFKAQALQQFDALLYASTPEELEALSPQLVITFGGHIVSKRLKQWLRKQPHLQHWHISPNGEIPDLFRSLTAVFETTPEAFFQAVQAYEPLFMEESVNYQQRWKKKNSRIPAPTFSYSEMGAITRLLQKLNQNTTEAVTLHLANSSTVRYAQLLPPATHVTVRCNRGVNGIEGSLSAAIGYAAGSAQTNYIIIGDLSFFYDMNALWNGHIRSNVRILLLNNSGGEIFHALPGLRLTDQARGLVTATHETRAKGWSQERGFEYHAVQDEKELKEVLEHFTSPICKRPQLVEVFTSKDEDVRLLKEYYHQLKQS